MFAHDELALLQISLGNPADAGGLVVGVLFDHAGEAAQLLEALLLPLADQVGVGVLLDQQVVIQLSRYLVFGVEEVVDVPGPLVVDLRDLPVVLDLALGVQGAILRVLHLPRELVQDRQDVLEALGRLLRLQRSDFRHQTIIKLSSFDNPYYRDIPA